MKEAKCITTHIVNVITHQVERKNVRVKMDVKVYWSNNLLEIMESNASLLTQFYSEAWKM